MLISSRDLWLISYIRREGISISSGSGHGSKAIYHIIVVMYMGGMGSVDGVVWMEWCGWSGVDGVV